MIRASRSCVVIAMVGGLAALAHSPCAAQTAMDRGVASQSARSLWVEDLDLNCVEQDWGTPHRAQSVEGHAIRLSGKTYDHGLGTHANGQLIIDLHGAATRFEATVGVDDEVGAPRGRVVFEVYVDGERREQTQLLHCGSSPIHLSVPLSGAKRLMLMVRGVDGISHAHADWADARIALAAGAGRPPTAFIPPVEPARLVIPKPDPKPAIHGASVVGATPHRPFLFRVPTTGSGPFAFSARGLPAGLALDRATGIISGSLRSAGTTRVSVSARNALGRATRLLTIIGGRHVLAQTPPMGWNSWNVWAGSVDDAKVRAAGDAMVASGLAAHGYQYVNIDDTWEGKRDAAGDILSNSKFPDMKALTTCLHGKGLKAGIYSSPGPKTCAGFEACYHHEAQDAARYAEWGFDYLKYDLCSYSGVTGFEDTVPGLRKPYETMRRSLDGVDRDILYSLCEYGNGDVWKWGAKVGGNCWRTTGDINDSWGSLYRILEDQAGHEAYAGPGHWNDPDMLVVGLLGWGDVHPTRLKPNEQITHISMWCMLSAPLLIGCDMTKLDALTRAVLMNDEVLDIDQDALGKPASRRMTTGGVEVWTRPLADGSTAVALVNPDFGHRATLRFADLGIPKRQRVRDLWLHKSLGVISGCYSVEVPTHGTVLLKLRPASR